MLLLQWPLLGHKRPLEVFSLCIWPFSRFRYGMEKFRYANVTSLLSLALSLSAPDSAALGPTIHFTSILTLRAVCFAGYPTAPYTIAR